ncbi:MAG: hypothetical protein EBT50_08035, partial [Verrucomicrobia bacterium]|nr:hypothetical protein [Verrucomicrobiota bacterium]
VSGGITKQGNGELLLTGSSTYTGSTVVESGILKAGIQRFSFGINSATVLSNTAGAVLDLNGFDTTIGSLAGGGSTGGEVRLSSKTLTMGGDNTSTVYSGTITGTNGNGQILKVGTGTQTFTASNSYTGATTVNGGTLKVTTNNALGGNAGRLTVNSNGVIDVYNTQYTSAKATTLGGGTIANGSGNSLFAGNITLSANSVADVTGASLILSGGITGAFDLNKTGSGTLTLAGTGIQNSTTISQGTLQLGTGGTTGWLTGNIFNYATLALNRSDSVSLGGQVSGTGAIIKNGANTVTLTNSNSYSGLTTIAGGVLQVGNGGTNGTLGIGDVTNSGVLTFNRSDSLSYGGMISGTGRLSKLAAGTVTLTGNHSYSGGTTISAGILEIGNGGTSGAIGSGAITNQGVLAFNRSDNLNVPGGISGNGELRQNGTGTLTLSGASTYTGATRVNAGRLATTGDDLLSDASAVIVAGGATLQLGGNDGIGSLAGAGAVVLGTNTLTMGYDNTSTTFSGGMSGLGGITKLGTGNLTLNGTSTFKGDAVLAHLQGRRGAGRREDHHRQFDRLRPQHLPGCADRHRADRADEHPGRRPGNGGNNQPGRQRGYQSGPDGHLSGGDQCGDRGLCRGQQLPGLPGRLAQAVQRHHHDRGDQHFHG